MNYEFNFDHQNNDFIEAIGINKDKQIFLERRIRELFGKIDEKNEGLAKSEVLEYILTGIPGNISPIELYFIGSIVGVTMAAMDGKLDHDVSQKHVDKLMEAVDMLIKKGVSPEKAIEQVMDEMVNHPKLKEHVLSGENDF